MTFSIAKIYNMSGVRTIFLKTEKTGTSSIDHATCATFQKHTEYVDQTYTAELVMKPISQ